jgi:uncharacterized protein (TIGR03435 family)
MLKTLSWTSMLLTCVLAIDDSALLVAAQSTSHNPSSSISSATSLEFEVASIKRTNLDQKNVDVNLLRTYPGARVVARGANLDFLLMETYNLQRYQIVGGPSWIREAKFDIDAKPPDAVALRYAHLTGSSKTPPPDEIRQMLRNLLVERFQIKLDLQQRQGQIYALVTSGGPLRLRPSKDSNEFPWAGSVAGGLPSDDGLRGINESMVDLAARLSHWLSKPVVDKTGLVGSYDFQVIVPSSSDDTDSGLAVNNNLFESLGELGLSLKKSTGLVQTLIIKQASLPSAN